MCSIHTMGYYSAVKRNEVLMQVTTQMNLKSIVLRSWMLRAGALGRPRGTVWGGRREEASGWGTHVYLWRIHFDIWQNQYNIVKFKNKIKLKKQTKKTIVLSERGQSQKVCVLPFKWNCPRLGVGVNLGVCLMVMRFLFEVVKIFWN